jgi:hypothetical protein
MKKVMLMWVETVLKLHIITVPKNIVPIFLLDLHRLHLMASIGESIQELGVKVEHISGGCIMFVNPWMLGLTNHSNVGFVIIGSSG